jgi:hypothetical protein
MIYEFPAVGDPIRQGDIFASLPKLDISLAQMFVVGEEEGVTQERRWEDVVSEELGKDQFVRLVVTARTAVGIVITQDCDTQFGPSITLSSVLPIAEVVKELNNTKTPKAFQKEVRNQNKKNLKWFYLPPDEQMNFKEKMAVDFQLTFSVPREGLQGLRSLRLGRLNPEADEHFRERLSEFYRRYPVDDWYPLNPEEFEAYRASAPEATPRPWQVPKKQ